MTSTPFDSQLRTLRCPVCGAPLVAPRQGGSVRCEYCLTTSTLSAREMAPGAGQRSSLAEETARLSRLKAQLEHPVAGHPYDLTRAPEDFGGSRGVPPTDVERLYRQWGQALKEPATSSVENQRRVCWIALQAARLSQEEEPLRMRAHLETTLEWLIDEGYRHLIRCQLAMSALQDGQAEAAEGWLKECDLAPEVLELDSASRLVRAWLACRRGRADQVFELLGQPGAEPPIIPFRADEAQRLRVDALEARGRREEAYVAFHGLVRKNGLDAEIALFQAYQLAPKTVALVERDVRKEEMIALRHRQEVAEQERIETLRNRMLQANRHRLRYTARSATLPLRWLPVGALLLFLPVFTLRCSADVDPLGGIYGYPLCPTVCPECRGPTRVYTTWVQTGSLKWSTNGPKYYCRTPTNRVADITDETLEATRVALRPYELGGFSSFMASVFILIPLLLPVGVFLSIKRAISNRAEAERISNQLRELAQELGEDPPEAPRHLWPSLRNAALSILGAGFVTALLAWWTV